MLGKKNQCITSERIEMELNQSDWNKEMVFFIQKQQIAATRGSVVDLQAINY